MKAILLPDDSKRSGEVTREHEEPGRQISGKNAGLSPVMMGPTAGIRFREITRRKIGLFRSARAADKGAARL